MKTITTFDRLCSAAKNIRIEKKKKKLSNIANVIQFLLSYDFSSLDIYIETRESRYHVLTAIYLLKS